MSIRMENYSKTDKEKYGLKTEIYDHLQNVQIMVKFPLTSSTDFGLSTNMLLSIKPYGSHWFSVSCFCNPYM